ncbi:MAG: DUF1844 domain-containing protein [Bacteroidota bacterium]|nr:DUF1844 domain-containing protein [Bacteroidota bacterium]
MADQEKHQQLFIQLISMFHAAALQQMGKLKDPISDKIERDLNQAELSIDMLDMLTAKTKGNVTAEEERALTDIIAQLKLNFVDEKTKEQPKQ